MTWPWSRKKEPKLPQVCQCGHGKAFHGDGRSMCFFKTDRYEMCMCQHYVLNDSRDAVAEELGRIFDRK